MGGCGWVCGCGCRAVTVTSLFYLTLPLLLCQCLHRPSLVQSVWSPVGVQFLVGLWRDCTGRCLCQVVLDFRQEEGAMVCSCGSFLQDLNVRSLVVSLPVCVCVCASVCEGEIVKKQGKCVCVCGI